MGDIADAMLDGTLCEGCGVALYPEDPPGYPCYCADCHTENEAYDVAWGGRKPQPPLAHSTKIVCPFCQRSVKAVGYSDHFRAIHLK